MGNALEDLGQYTALPLERGTTNSFAIAFLWRKLKTYCQALADELNCAKNSAQRARSLSCILHDDALEKRVCDVHALFVALANELPQ